ncbi:hypothetical protein PINS_up015856 [Pythium insidiosum]|nr:hypothetical protein PINS_up015856 [Pythium insidiosum]
MDMESEPLEPSKSTAPAPASASASAPASQSETTARPWWSTRQVLQLLVACVFGVAFWTFGTEYAYLLQPRNKALWDAMSRASDWGRAGQTTSA